MKKTTTNREITFTLRLGDQLAGAMDERKAKTGAPYASMLREALALYFGIEHKVKEAG